MSIRKYGASIQNASDSKSKEQAASKYAAHTQAAIEYEIHDHKQADHIGRQQNHIWSKDEIDYHLKSLYHHKPVTFSDKVMNGIVSSLSFSFSTLMLYLR